MIPTAPYTWDIRHWERQLWSRGLYGRVVDETSPMKPGIQKALRLLRNCRGNVMIEFAIGSEYRGGLHRTLQFGYTFSSTDNLGNAVARGARYASLVPYDRPVQTRGSVQDSGTEHGLVRDRPQRLPRFCRVSGPGRRT